MELTTLLTAIACVTFGKMSLVYGHGRLMDPPARNSMWRFGFNNPTNYRDNELFCGGPKVWKKSGFKCGICGDLYGDPNPQYTAGGRYARGIIGRKYKAGQEIPVEVQLTANHWGRFEMYVCPNNDPSKEASQTCFDRYPLYLAGTKNEVKFEIPRNHQKWGIFRYSVRLPPGLTCTQCVLQWTYYTGRVWGRCSNGTDAIGCDGLSAFRNCADIAILGGSQGGNSLKPNLTNTGYQPAYTFFEGTDMQSPEDSGMSQNPPVSPEFEASLTSGSQEGSSMASANEVEADIVPQAVVKSPSPATSENTDGGGTLQSSGSGPSVFRDTEPLPELPRPIRSTVCVATKLFKKLTGADEWCMQRCMSYPPVCPNKMCICPDTCDAVGDIAEMPGAESFCQGQCILYPYQCHDHQESRCRCYKANNDTNLYANYFEFSATNVLDYELY